MIVRLARRAVLLAVAVLCVVAMLPAQSPAPSSLPAPDLAPAADTSAFRPGNIISNAVFYDSGAMSASQIQGFLGQQGANCREINGAPCLKDYAMATPTRAADAYCDRYAGSARESAAQIIAKVSVACDINPRVLLVTLQKEMGFITSRGPTPKMYTRAMGYGCPDNAGGLCDSTYNGLFNQLYMAARQFQRYTAGVSGGYRAGIANNIQYNPDPDCGSTRVVIENQATANLYNYTPYQPNAAALAAGYGTGDGCSAYGNRNFWLHFTDWFGSTQTVGRDVDAPVGALDEVRTGVSTITVRGWTFDPNAPTQSIDVHVYVDGRFSTRMPANKPRPDVAAAFQGVGPATGYHGTVAAPPGQHTVCVYSVNTGRGYTNPLRGCRTVTVKAYVPKVPFGAQDSVAVSAHTVSVRGWVVDPDVPRSPVRVHMYVDGRWSGAVTADVARTDVALAYPSATANHGYEWSGTLPAGRHEVCAHAINLGAGTVNPRVGCRTVTLGGPPTGQLEDVTVAPGEVRIEGWAVDPDTVDPIRVQVYVDGAYHSSPLANGDRPDIAAARPGSGAAHGLDVTLPLASGERNVCLVAKNVLSGRPSHVPLGCRTVTVPATQFVPIGNLDSATVSGTTVTATGWALDQDSPTAALRVHVYVDGKSTTAWKIWADRGRADIELQYPEAGADHGFQLDLDLSSLPRGDHQVCAWAINILGGSSNTKLPCRTVRTS